METPSPYGPAGMSQLDEFELLESDDGGRRELQRYELLLNVLIVSVVVCVKSVAAECIRETQRKQRECTEISRVGPADDLFSCLTEQGDVHVLPIDDLGVHGVDGHLLRGISGEAVIIRKGGWLGMCCVGED